MSYIDRMLARQAALAGQLAAEREPELALSAARAVFSLRAQQPDAQRAPDTDADAAGPDAARQAQKTQPPGQSASGAQALLQAFSALTQQRTAIGALRQEANEREIAGTRERQSVWLSARTPQNTPAGLTGAYEQTLTVAGPAAAPTTRSMAEISRYFERDARRYGG